MKEIRPGALCRRPLHPDPVGRLLCAARQGRRSLAGGHDDDDPGCRRRRAARSPSLTPPGPRRQHRRRDPGGGEALAGVKEVYKCGGAQGVAAVAYGTQTVPKMAKIVGPGSPYVVAAKRPARPMSSTPAFRAGPWNPSSSCDETAQRPRSPP